MEGEREGRHSRDGLAASRGRDQDLLKCKSNEEQFVMLFTVYVCAPDEKLKIGHEEFVSHASER